MLRPCILLLLVWAGARPALQGQSALLSWLFKPGLRVSGLYLPSVAGDDRASLLHSRAALILPVHSKFDVDINWDELFKVRRWKDLLNVPEVRAHQIFAQFSLRTTALRYTPRDSTRFDPFPGEGYHLMYGVGGGVTGIHLLPRFRLLFYTANIGLNEDFRGGIMPEFQAAAGVVKISKPWFWWYYGGFIGFQNGRILPAPILGGEIRFLNRYWMHVTLPVQMRLGCRIRKKTSLELLLSLWGLSSGFSLDTPADRAGLNLGHFKSGVLLTWKLGRQWRFSLEGGWAAGRRMRFNSLPAAVTATWPEPNPSLKGSPYVGLSLYYAFRKSLLDSRAGDLLGN